MKRLVFLGAEMRGVGGTILNVDVDLEGVDLCFDFSDRHDSCLGNGHENAPRRIARGT